MRKLTLAVILLTVFSVSSIFAQFTFVRIDPPVVYGPDTMYTQIKSHGVVRNTTNSTIMLHINLINRYVTPGWDSVAFCDWHYCYPPGHYSDSSLIGPMATETLYVYFSPNGVQGNGHCTVRINYQSTVINQDFAVEANPIGIKQISSTVEEFALGQNYPNPFNPTTKIGFSLPRIEFVSLRVYDILGREVKVLVSQSMQPGEYEVDFDAQNLSSGMYYYSLRAGENVSVKKMVLVK